MNDKITYNQAKSIVDMIDTSAGKIPTITNTANPNINYNISDEITEKCNNYVEEILEIMKEIIWTNN